MVVLPENVAGPETVRLARVEVAALKLPVTLSLPLMDALPVTLSVPWMFAVCVVKLPEDKSVKPARVPPLKLWFGVAGM